MKHIIIVGDGMGDRPIKELDNRTPLQAADKPNIDALAKRGRSGLLQTVAKGYPPGSDVANLSILGYEPDLYYPGGRGPIEAASQGIPLKPGDLALRANIITVENGRIKDYSAGQIRNDEAKELIALANKEFGEKGVEFYTGISYRNLMVLRNTTLEPNEFRFSAPHDHGGEEIVDLLAEGDEKAEAWAERLNDWTLRSQELFEKSSVNKKRVKEGRPLANMLWFWGPGKKRREMPTLKEKFGWTGVVISGVDLIKGLGALAGLRIADVRGATAYFDTNFEGKADAAVDALEIDDIAFIHIEAPDEAGHEGLVNEKIKAIENIDKRVVGRIVEKMDKRGEPYRIGFLCDHATPVRVRTHTEDPIPFIISGAGVEKDGVTRYDEESAKKGGYGLKRGPEFMGLMAKP